MKKDPYPIIRKWVDGREFLESPTTRLRVQRRTINPSAGELWMRCGVCGGRSFKPLTRPTLTGTAQIVSLVCDDSRGGGCLKVYKLDMSGCLSGGGKIDAKQEDTKCPND